MHPEQGTFHRVVSLDAYANYGTGLDASHRIASCPRDHIFVWVQWFMHRKNLSEQIDPQHSTKTLHIEAARGFRDNSDSHSYSYLDPEPVDLI